METRVILDIETSDPLLVKGFKGGYKYGQAEFLVAVTITEGDSKKVWRSVNGLLEYLKQFKCIVGHNISYDIGVLHQYGFDFTTFILRDTQIVAKYHDNRLQSYSLDNLCQYYFKEHKADSKLGDIAKQLGLVKSKAQNATRIAKINMKAIYNHAPEEVIKYCIQDVLLTDTLDRYLKKLEPGFDELFYSDLLKCLLQSRINGINFNIISANRLSQMLQQKINPLQETLQTLLPEVNFNSSSQLASAFLRLGLYPKKTELGNLSVDSQWMANQSHPVVKKLQEYKELVKLHRDFVAQFIEQNCSVIHPNVSIFGAIKTGRMSCSDPNFQQIPTRNEQYGKFIRGMFYPKEGQNWYSLDFSSQEPRLAVHFAKALDYNTVNPLIELYHQDKTTDLHKVVAKIVGIEKKQAKTINLGLLYGMGKDKLADSLKVSINEADRLRKAIKDRFPFFNQLNRHCMQTMIKRGYLYSISGRKLYNEQGFEYKALNKVIQGSAADQLYSSLVICYRNGIIPLIPIHDELCLSLGTDKEAKEVQSIMEKSLPLSVPSYVKVSKGPNWGELKELI